MDNKDAWYVFDFDILILSITISYKPLENTYWFQFSQYVIK